ncbi:hypothetical protein LTR37_017482 [Vermiconidia calcicola]|uniref:Uncharacterized protein n=1 Tax=Vermiconidia calcicola TaxID=1690605 RepID=A0ACC3MJV7_9PEZI|nr:hypothetical protein LTR37_017482 [Vermiconidia calcicola]
MSRTYVLTWAQSEASTHAGSSRDLRDRGADGKFYLIVGVDTLQDAIRKLGELDAHEDVFTIIAHDWSLMGIINKWPRPLRVLGDRGLEEEDSVEVPSRLPKSYCSTLAIGCGLSNMKAFKNESAEGPLA